MKTHINPSPTVQDVLPNPKSRAWLRTLLKALMVAGSMLWLGLIAASWSAAEAAASTRDREGGRDGDNEYNFSWLDPDKKIYVLQNRRYLKANRLMLSGLIGPGVSDPYRSVVQISPRAAYYFSELLGVEVFYTLMSNSENVTMKSLRASSSGALPSVREIQSEFGVLLHYVPWYAKINVFNQILYFDWYFSGGLGQIATQLVDEPTAGGAKIMTKETLAGGFLGTGHQYHLSESFTVRLDFSGAFFTAPAQGKTGEKTVFSNYVFGVGVGIRL